MESLQPVIQVLGISKVFGKQTALRDVSFQVAKGEIFGFLGPSGAGKTTTIKILTGQLLPTVGQATLLGHSVTEIDEHIYEQVGIVGDTSGLYERLSVVENLRIFARLLNVDKARIDVLLKRVGLDQDRDKQAGKLSTGMKQRLRLVRAILHQPRVLFLDEPTSGLDPSSVADVHKLILELKAQGTAIFLTTHNMTEATQLCDRVALLNDGVIQEQGTPQELSLKYNRHRTYQVLLADNQSLTLPENEETATRIRDWMIAGEIRSIHSNEPSLEDIFLEVTGRSLA